jgi:hypothetical protein
MTVTTDHTTAFVAFWNDTLAAKSEPFRNILMKGLSHPSAVWLDAARIAPGARIVDVVCGWGDTAPALARRTGAAALGPAGEVFREAGQLAEERRGEIKAALGAATAALSGRLVRGAARKPA